MGHVTATAARPSQTARYELLLRAWEVVSTERHLQGVLAAVSEVLLPIVPWRSVGIIWFDGSRHDLFAIHVAGHPFREGETLQDFLARTTPPPKEVPARPLIPYHFDAASCYITDPQPYACDDLLAKDAWWEHEFHLAAGGVRTYCSVPLVVRGKLIGAAAYTRTDPVPFTPEQIAILMEVARPLAVAVANAVANEEIRSLRQQVEAENIQLRSLLGERPWFEEIVGDSAPLHRMLEAIEQVAGTDATVLITGETGTGKELVARAIHRRSPRASGPLVKVNCSAIPETLLASELFGYERGAFTGAAERRKGRFEQAHGGTLFLDEIGELSPEMQVMLLRVLQESEFERLGGGPTVHVDVRVIAATNQNLPKLVQEGRFRSDLFYRLNVFPIEVPALRERPEDVPILAGHFAAKYGERFGRRIARIDAQSMLALRGYDWPGNVRELENTIERAVILSTAGTLRCEAPARAAAQPAAPERDGERQAIEAALAATRGRISGTSGAAARLGMPASTLEFRIKKLGIDKFGFRRRA